MSPLAWVLLGVAAYVVLVLAFCALRLRAHRRAERKRVAGLPLPVLQEELRAREQGRWP